MGERAKVSVARFPEGVIVRVRGPGTMTESRLVHAFAEQVLNDQSQRVVIDLASCSYLDSTFLGGLVSLHKRHGAGVAGPQASTAEGRFFIHAPAEQRRLLFSVSRLDQLLPFAEKLPPAQGEENLTLEVDPYASREELTRYIADCHRRLAELGGAEAQDFGRVADALENELRTPSPSRPVNTRS
jgi:anti-sigma B factor antagonist